MMASIVSLSTLEPWPSTTSGLDDSDDLRVVNWLVFCVAVCGIFLNGTCIYLFLRASKFTVGDIFGLAICITNLIEVVLWVLLFVCMKTQLDDSLFASFLAVLNNFVILYEWFSNVGLAVCRYHATAFPYQFKDMYSKRILTIIFGVFGCTALVICVPMVFLDVVFATKRDSGIELYYVRYSFIAVFLVCVGVILTSYGMVNRHFAKSRTLSTSISVRAPLLSRKSFSVDRFNSTLQNILDDKTIVLEISFLLVTIAFIVLNIPLFATQLSLDIYSGYDIDIYDSPRAVRLVDWAYLVQMSQTIVDPLIWIMFRKDFKRKVSCGHCYSPSRPATNL